MEEFDLNKDYTGVVLKKPNGREVWVIIGVNGEKNVIYLTSTDSDNYYDCNSNVCYKILPNPKNGLAKPTRFKLVPRYLPFYTFQLYFPIRPIGWLDNVDIQDIRLKLKLFSPE